MSLQNKFSPHADFNFSSPPPLPHLSQEKKIPLFSSPENRKILPLSPSSPQIFTTNDSIHKALKYRKKNEEKRKKPAVFKGLRGYRGREESLILNDFSGWMIPLFGGGRRRRGGGEEP